MAFPGYLRFPHVHGELLAFVAEDDVWLAPADGGRAWRLTSDRGRASVPRFSPDGTQIAWTSLRDGMPEVYSAATDAGQPRRRTYWGDHRTKTIGWNHQGEILAVSAVGQPSGAITLAYAIAVDAPPRPLPFGQVNDLAQTEGATALLTGRLAGEPAFWKRYRGGTAGRLWVAAGEDPLFSRVHSGLNGQFGAPMLIGGRLAFLSDHEGTGNLYSSALDGSDLRRHTDHDGFYARNPATDGTRIVYHVAGDLWLLDSLDAAAPRQLGIELSSSSAARGPRPITAHDVLGDLSPDETGQASVVEVRGTVHWLTHADGPARALLVDPAARASRPRVLGPTGQVAWITDVTGVPAVQVAGVGEEADGSVRTIEFGDRELGDVLSLEASPDGARLAAAGSNGSLVILDVASGEVTELARNDDGEVENLCWSTDSAWLAWAQPGPQPLARIRLARVADGFTVDVTDGRFYDSEPVFTLDGLYLAFLSRRTFDPVYDQHSFDLSFPFGARPYLVPLAAHTLSPFGPQPGGRPVSGDNAKDSGPERAEVTVDPDGIAARVIAIPVDEARYAGLAAVKGGLLWLRSSVAGVLGEGGASLDDERPGPTLERFDLRKRDVSTLSGSVSWYTVSGDGTRLVIVDDDDVKVVPSDRKADNGSSDDVITVDLTRARFTADPVALWGHAYAEYGRLIRRDFWDPDMSGVDWDGVLDSYRFLVDRVSSSTEFGDLLWEVAGELGTSHAYITPSSAFSGRTAVRGTAAARLGADVTRADDGRWLVTRILPGESSDPYARSPLTAPGVAVREGDEILAVDGQPVDPVYGPWPALAGTADKPVELTIRPADPALVPRPPAAPAGGSDPEADPAADSAAAANSASPVSPASPVTSSDPTRPSSLTTPITPSDPTRSSASASPGSPSDPTSPSAASSTTGTSDATSADAWAEAVAEGGAGEGGLGGVTLEQAAASAAAAETVTAFPATRRVVVVPLSGERRLRYQAWVSGRRQFVRARSDGRLGYLHVPDMLGEGWAHFHRDLRGEMGREGLIVDVRSNRGGHTSQLIVEKLVRRITGWKIARRLRPFSYPQDAPRGPVVAVTDEFAGSDGDIVTAAIRTLGIGPVIGTRTWGGVVGIDGSGHELVDGTRLTIPRYASWFTQFGWSVENYGVDPDVEVLITPEDWAAGRDPQLEVAVDRALASLAENPPPPIPTLSDVPTKRRPPLPPR